MKTIVISGARSNVGKTTLTRAIGELLPGSVQIKLGHGKVKSTDDGYFYRSETPCADIFSRHALE